MGQDSKDKKGANRGKEVSYRLPSLPASMNQIYNIVFGKKLIYLKPEVRRYRSDMKMFVPMPSINDWEYTELEFTVCADWFYKNGKLRKIDIQNLLKVLVDLIAEKQGCGS